ncbi:MotA/TolQ/ExbB proton channel family protein [bacterium]|nr:MotA/TolQ/ExbB proton channel family protein [bacterium]
MLTHELLKATNFGAEWILWLLIGLFMLEIAIMVERGFFYFKYRLNINKFQSKFRELLFSGDIESVKSELSKKRSFETNALIEGVKMIDFGAESVEETIESMKSTNKIVLERNLTVLGTLGNNTPFIGLFGTVLGIIKAFKDLAEASNSAGGDMLKAGQAAVMAGIAEALIATGVGLAVAIPAVIAFNYFTRKVKVIQTNTDVLTGVLMSYIKRDEESETPDNNPTQKKMNTSVSNLDSKNDSKKKIELNSEKKDSVSLEKKDLINNNSVESSLNNEISDEKNSNISEENSNSEEKNSESLINSELKSTESDIKNEKNSIETEKSVSKSKKSDKNKKGKK